MSFLYQGASKRFKSTETESLLSQILREPVPNEPIIMDFSYLSKPKQLNEVNNESAPMPALKLPTMLIDQVQCVQQQINATPEKAKPIFNSDTIQIGDTLCYTDSTEAILNAIFCLNKNLSIQPASEFDNFYFYPDMPIYDD